MGRILEFKKKKIAFVGEMIREDGSVVHSPYLYKISYDDTGKEISPRLFTIDDLEDLPCDDDNINSALEAIYRWCYDYFNDKVDEDSDTYKLYAVSLDDRMILYSLVLSDSSWMAADCFMGNCLPQFFGSEPKVPADETEHTGNNIYIMGEVLDANGEIYHTPVVKQINEIESSYVMFPGLFRKRTLKSFLEYEKYQLVIGCLFECLINEAEEMGADTLMVREDNEFQHIRLEFIDRKTGRILYVINAIQSSVDGNIIIPEKWDTKDTLPRYIDMENAEIIDLSVEVEDVEEDED